MSSDVEPKLVKSTLPIPRFIIYVGVLLAVFLLGFVPMWLKARATTNTLAKTEQELLLVKMQNNLGSAVIDARRGNYEPARQAVSQFFTSLHAEIDKGDASTFTPAQRVSMQALLAGRDEIITLLARSDPASADRLSDLYVAYRNNVNGQTAVAGARQSLTPNSFLIDS